MPAFHRHHFRTKRHPVVRDQPVRRALSTVRGSDVVSEWQLEWPTNQSKDASRQFDYDVIADVIIHLCYTIREGGGLLRNGAVANLRVPTGIV
jgi:Tc toxin complex TcA C-terminal TcB-binding domain